MKKTHPSPEGESGDELERFTTEQTFTIRFEDPVLVARLNALAQDAPFLKKQALVKICLLYGSAVFKRTLDAVKICDIGMLLTTTEGLLGSTKDHSSIASFSRPPIPPPPPPPRIFKQKPIQDPDEPNFFSLTF